MPSAREKELSEQLACATAELGKTSSELSGLRTENKLLRERIDALLRRIFGAQSEKLDAAQLLLMLQGFEAPGKAPEPVEAEAPRRSTAPSPPRSDRGPRWPADLPVVREEIDPEPVAARPEAWRCTGEKSADDADSETSVVRSREGEYFAEKINHLRGAILVEVLRSRRGFSVRGGSEPMTLRHHAQRFRPRARSESLINIPGSFAHEKDQPG